jgi:competence protein ComEA
MTTSATNPSPADTLLKQPREGEAPAEPITPLPAARQEPRPPAQASPTPVQEKTPSGFQGLPRHAQLGLAFLLGILTLLLTQHAWKRLAPAGRPSELWPSSVSASQYLVDLNKAPREEIQQLPGIGPTLAKRIVDDREQNGRFASLEDLRRVHGIGSATVETLRSRVKVEGDATSTSAAKPTAAKSTSGRKPELTGRIDLNRAGRQELMQLPGIGPVTADHILADRQANGPFRTVQDLTRIKGIKGKTLEKLLPHVYVTEPVARGRDGA